MLPAACARSQPTTAPASWPAAVSRSMSNACPVAKLTPPRKTRARSSAWSAMAVSRSSIRTRCSPSRGPMTTRSVAGSSPRWARWLVSAWRSDGKSGPSARIRRRRPSGRKNEASSRWMLTVRLLSRAISTGRAPTTRAIDSRRVASRVNHGTRGVEPCIDSAAAPRRRAPWRSPRRRSAAAARATGLPGRSPGCRRAPSGCGTGRASSASALRPRRVPARLPRSWAGLRCRANCERRVAFGDARTSIRAACRARSNHPDGRPAGRVQRIRRRVAARGQRIGSIRVDDGRERDRRPPSRRRRRRPPRPRCRPTARRPARNEPTRSGSTRSGSRPGPSRWAPTRRRSPP